MQDDDAHEDKLADIVPSSLKNMRACTSCYLVKRLDQFIANGCENCEHLKMEGDKQNVEENTTTNFDGLIALANPKDSWVARYQNIANKMPGVYAVRVHGGLEDNK